MALAKTPGLYLVPELRNVIYIYIYIYINKVDLELKFFICYPRFHSLTCSSGNQNLTEHRIHITL